MTANKIDRDDLIKAACHIADEYGVAAITVRQVAQRCGISVGSVYKVFPAKKDLVVAAIVQYFDRALRQDFCHPQPNEKFIPYCRRMQSAIQRTAEEFESRWLRDADALTHAEAAAGKVREAQQMEHIRQGMEYVLTHDSSIDAGSLEGKTSAARICSLMLDVLMEDIRQGTDHFDTLVPFVEAKLYRSSGPSQSE